MVLTPDLLTPGRLAANRCPTSLSGLHVYHQARRLIVSGYREVRLVDDETGAWYACRYPIPKRIPVMRCRCGAEQQLLPDAPDVASPSFHQRRSRGRLLRRSAPARGAQKDAHVCTARGATTQFSRGAGSSR